MRSIILLLLLCSLSALAQIRTNPLPNPIPVPVPGDDSGICKLTCSDSMARIHFKMTLQGTTTCNPAPKIVHGCAPYGCDASGKSCRTSCDQDADCTKGFACNTLTHQCVMVSYYCSVNQYRAALVVGTDGSYRSCEPYGCSMGKCIARCQSESDCWPGYRCTSNMTCERY